MPSVTVGVEEEFHTVSLSTRRLTAEGGRILEHGLPDACKRFSAELHQTVVEANSRPHARLADLAADIAALRRAAITAGLRCGLGVVAAGSVPIADSGTGMVTADPRYERMRGDYGTLVSEQLICAMQVHVSVADRDLAVAVAHRVAPWLPALLALSASSPYWLGTDTGYASYRTLIWRRWPTAGAPGEFASAADYDQTVADLVRSGVITDPGMIYFDVRPSAHLPTLELRICDSCPFLQGSLVLLAGLFRALVIREAASAAIAGPGFAVELSVRSCWRPRHGGPRGPAWKATSSIRRPPPRCQLGRLIRRLLADLRPELEGQRRLGAGDRAGRGGPRPGQLRRHASARHTPAAASRRSSIRCCGRPARTLI